MNLNINIDILSLNTISAVPQKGKASTSTSQIQEIVLCKFIIPMSSLFSSSKYALDANDINQCITFVHNDILEKKILASLGCDNDLRQSILGSTLLSWSKLLFKNLNSDWCLHVKPMDGKGVSKAKKPNTLTPEDIRSKSLEDIENLINTQGDVSYVANITAISTELSSFFPSRKFKVAKVFFDFEKAKSTSIDVDISSQPDLWSVEWKSSVFTYLSRSDSKKLISLLNNDSLCLLNMEIEKIPNANALSYEGDAKKIRGIVKIDSLLIANSTSFSMPMLSESEESSNNDTIFAKYDIILTLFTNKPLIKQLQEVASIPVNPEDLKIPSNIDYNSKQHSIKDVIKELQTDIELLIRTIGNEYIKLYPDPTDVTPTDKTNFIQHLEHTGIMHEMKEKLKPKLNEIIWDRYGARGQVLAKSYKDDLALNIPNKNSLSITGNTSIDNFLSDIYINMISQCNIILNQAYTNTLVDRCKAEIDGLPSKYSDDEIESSEQKFQRLKLLSHDYECNQVFEVAETIHLERILCAQQLKQQFNEMELEMWIDYSEFCLRAVAKLRYTNTAFSSIQATSFWNKAREGFFRVISNCDNMVDSWKYILIYICILIEDKQFADAESLFLKRVLHGVSLTSLNGFDGYDSDELCCPPGTEKVIDPLCFAILASYCNINETPLSVRKSLLLMNRCFSEKHSDIDLATHGKPRRTIVFCLAKAGLFLQSFGFSKLFSSCYLLIKESERAIREKVEARGLPDVTIPFIRHLHLRNAAAFFLLSGKIEESIKVSEDVLVISKSTEEIINGYLCLIQVKKAANSDTQSVIDTYLEMLSVVLNSKNETSEENSKIPLEAYIEMGRLLNQQMLYEKAIQLIIPAIKVYNYSATLYQFVGIALLRQEKYDSAFEFLKKSNILDDRNPVSWAYLCIVYLSTEKIDLGFKALQQAIRLKLTDSVLYRELAVIYISIDKLVVAEDLLRRAISIECKASEVGKGNPVTRKLFADVLASQNQSLAAIEEYQRIISEEVSDVSVKISAAQQAIILLESLGRTEDVKTVQNIIIALNKIL